MSNLFTNLFQTITTGSTRKATKRTCMSMTISPSGWNRELWINITKTLRRTTTYNQTPRATRDPPSSTSPTQAPQSTVATTTIKNCWLTHPDCLRIRIVRAEEWRWEIRTGRRDKLYSSTTTTVIRTQKHILWLKTFPRNLTEQLNTGCRSM